MSKGWFAFGKRVVDRLSDLQNVGTIENPEGIGYVGDPSLGIDLELYIKVEDGIISDAKFKAFGCAATIATISMVSEMLEGRSIEQALGISDKEIAKALGGLPPEKEHCAKWGRELIKSAIDDFLEKQNRLKDNLPP